MLQVAMSDCLNEDAVERFCNETLPVDEAVLVDVHLAECEQCRERVDARWKTLYGNLKRAPATRLLETQAAPSPHLIGRYKVLDTLGEGGFGVVFLAEQSEPVRRRVALKLIKPGMDSSAVIARFEAERQALALMNHPNVAKVFDAGTTDAADGSRPYFVMEHVPGVPITEHCDRHMLTVEDRLDLFLQACHAVQHAHQKGIIHRDLKPTNILVGSRDGQPEVKVIDFGVAKAMQQQLTEKTIHTVQGQMIGTPAYMSPEQAEMTAAEIDTRSDIYSLGVVLYEMLTGEYPHDPALFKSATYIEIQRMLREDEPSRPSTRVSLRQERTKKHARNRRADPAGLSRRLRGDLDWIVMKCLEKDPNRRYETANALVMDIGRHLANEPVLAGPPSASYRISKFVTRNRTPVAASGIVVLALIAATGVSIAFARSEARQRRDAVLAKQAAENAHEQAELSKRAESTAREREQKRADELEQVTQFLANMLAGSDPEEMGLTLRKVSRRQVRAGLERSWIEGDDGKMRKRNEDEIASWLARHDEAVSPENPVDTAREMLHVNILKPAKELLLSKFADQAEVQIRLLHALGEVYHQQGLLDEAEPAKRLALKLSRQVHAEPHVVIAQSLNNLANLLQSQGNLTDSETLYRQALAMRKALHGAEHIEVAVVASNLASLLEATGDYDAAELLFRESLTLRRKLQGNEHASVARGLNNLARLLAQKGDYEAALAMHREGLDMTLNRVGEEHEDVALSLNDLGGLLRMKGDTVAAERRFRESLSLARKLLGDEHPNVATSMSNLADVVHVNGDHAEAERLLRDALAILRKVYGDEHSKVGSCRAELATFLMTRGDYEAAEQILRRALTVERKRHGDQTETLAAILDNLARVLTRKGDLVGAEPLFRESLAIRRRLLGEHPGVASGLHNLAMLLYFKGDYDGAEPLCHESLRMSRKVLGAEHPDVAGGLQFLAMLHESKGDHEAAEPLHQEALAILRKRLGNEHLRVAECLSGYAKLLKAKGNYRAAEPLYRESLAMRRRLLGRDHVGVAIAVSDLAGVFEAIGQYEEALKLYRECLNMRRRLLGDTHIDVAAGLNNVARLLGLTGDHDASTEAFRQCLESARRLHGDEHVYVVKSFNNLANAFLVQQRFKEAEALLRRRAHRWDRVGHRNSWLELDGMRLLGEALLGQAQQTEVETNDRLRMVQEAELLLLESYEKMNPPSVATQIKREALDAVVRLYETWHEIQPDAGHDATAKTWRAKRDFANGRGP